MANLANAALRLYRPLMATMNISLPDAMKEWVERQATGGRYGNVSDYVRDLIRRDQEREKAIAEMRAFVAEGLSSGPGEPFDREAWRVERRADTGGLG